MKRVRVLIAGRVQGVWFRASAQEQAHRLGLSGWVRNRSDGRVEACFEGNDADVDAAIAWCRDGPSMASVQSVEVTAEPTEGDSGFSVR